MTLGEIADALDRAERLGTKEDTPEGLRYIQVSDTLARRISGLLREIESEREHLAESKWME